MEEKKPENSNIIGMKSLKLAEAPPLEFVVSMEAEK